MADAVVPPTGLELTGWRKVAIEATVTAAKASLKVSPRPMALLIRTLFKRTGAEVAASLASRAPIDIVSVLDERYGDSPDARLDVYVPGRVVRSGERLPVVVWTHGGAWVGGSKEEIAGYVKLIADHGFVGVAIRYSLAPESTYPTPVRQVMEALAYVTKHADRLHVDPSRILLAGDSAGAQITAQVAALVSNPGYAAQMDIAPPIAREQLRGVALFCGAYDPDLVDHDGDFRDFLTTVLWSYSGTRDYRTSPLFATMKVGDFVDDAFPPAFISAGNVDPLLEHSTQLAQRLEDLGVETETMFFPADHEPALNHEYQFLLDGDDAQAALRRRLAFLTRATS